MKTSLIVVLMLTFGLATSLAATTHTINTGRHTKEQRTKVGGIIDFDVKNSMTMKADDIHFEIQGGWRLKEVSAGQPFTNRWPNPTLPPQGPGHPPSATGGADGGEVDSDGNGQVMIQFKIVDANGNAAPANTKITFTIQWSRFGNAVAMVLPDAMGEEGDTMLANVVPDYNATPVNVTLGLGTESVTCNDIAIGETYKYRFESGSLVVKPTRGRFVLQDDTVVKGFTEDGEDVTGTAMFSVANLRINSRGYLVFEVSRAADHDEHVAIVIRGLKLAGLELYSDPIDIHAGVSGAAVSGECLDGLIHIANLQEE